MMMAGLGGTGRGEKETENKTGKIQPFGAGGDLEGQEGDQQNRAIPTICCRGGVCDNEMRGFPPS